MSKLAEIRARIESAKAAPAGADDVTLIAVSKTKPAADVAELFAAGQRDFGENYVQELVEKSAELERLGCAGARWHFIGHLQTNKVKQLLPVVASIHSVDSERLAREIAKRWRALRSGAGDSGGGGAGAGISGGASAKLPIFIEVNIDGEESKSGVRPEDAPALAELIGRELSAELDLRGLMCVPAAGPIESARAAFAQLRSLELSCRPWTRGALSMGMSSDFEAAVAEGATHVRVGTALFGKRP